MLNQTTEEPRIVAKPETSTDIFKRSKLAKEAADDAAKQRDRYVEGRLSARKAMGSFPGEYSTFMSLIRKADEQVVAYDGLYKARLANADTLFVIASELKVEEDEDAQAAAAAERAKVVAVVKVPEKAAAATDTTKPKINYMVPQAFHSVSEAANGLANVHEYAKRYVRNTHFVATWLRVMSIPSRGVGHDLDYFSKVLASLRKSSLSDGWGNELFWAAEAIRVESLPEHPNIAKDDDYWHTELPADVDEYIPHIATFLTRQARVMMR